MVFNRLIILSLKVHTPLILFLMIVLVIVREREREDFLFEISFDMKRADIENF